MKSLAYLELSQMETFLFEKHCILRQIAVQILCCGDLNLYLNPRHSIKFILHIQRDYFKHIWGPLGSKQSQKTDPITLFFPTVSLAWFWMGKIMLQQPQIIAKLAPSWEYIKSVPSNFKSHIWDAWGPYQCPETTQNTNLTHTFLIMQYWLFTTHFAVAFICDQLYVDIKPRQ